MYSTRAPSLSKFLWNLEQHIRAEEFELFDGFGGTYFQLTSTSGALANSSERSAGVPASTTPSIHQGIATAVRKNDWDTAQREVEQQVAEDESRASSIVRQLHAHGMTTLEFLRFFEGIDLQPRGLFSNPWFRLGQAAAELDLRELATLCASRVKPPARAAMAQLDLSIAEAEALMKERLGFLRQTLRAAFLKTSR